MKGTYTIILVFAALSFLGLFVISKVPIRFTDSNVTHNIILSYSWPNAAPEALERQVTAPLEGILSTVQEIKTIESSSNYNNGSINLMVDKNVNFDKLRFEIASLIRQVYRKLPQGVSYPTISFDDPDQKKSSGPLLSVQLNSNETSGNLRKYIEAVLKPKLIQLDGIRSVEVYGGEPDEWLLHYNPFIMSSLKISENDIIQAVNKKYQTSNLGWINSKVGIRQSISVAPGFTDLDFNTISVLAGDRMIRLPEVVKIKRMERPATTYFRINSKSAVQIVLKAESGVNQLTVSNGAKKLLKAITTELPTGFNIRIDYDATDYIRENLNQLYWKSSLSILILILFTVLIFHRWKATFICVTSLFVNLLLTALILYIFKIEVKLFSIATLIVSLGLISSNIIITLYQYYNYRSRMVVISLVGTTLIMCASLSISWLVPEQIRIGLTDFAKLIMLTEILSLFVCFWFVPAIIEQLNLTKKIQKKSFTSIRDKIESFYYTLLQFLLKFRRLSITFSILVFGLPLFLLPQNLPTHTKFGNIYNSIFGDQWYSDRVRPYVDKVFGGSLRVFSNYVYEKSFYTSNDQTALYINVGMPNHSTIGQMDEALRVIESELNQHTEIDRFITQIFSPQQGSIIIYFNKPYDKGYFPYRIKDKLISISTEMSGIDWEIFGVGQGFNFNSNQNETPEYNIILRGYNYKKLESLALNFQKLLLLHPRIQVVDVNKVPGVFSQKDLYAYVMQTDAAYWGRHGISKYNLYKAIEKYDARPQPDLYQLIGDSYEGINIRPITETPFDITALKNEPLAISDTILLKVGGHGSILKEEITPTIRKKDKQYIRQISFEYMGSSNFGEKFLDKTLKTFLQDIALGYTAEKQTFGNWKIDDKRGYELIILSLLFIFIIGGIMFESLRQPFTLIASIALSFVGLFLTFYSFDAGFDQGGYASFLIVIGIVSLPIVMIINEYNSQFKTGLYSPQKAYLNAVRSKTISIIYYLISSLIGIVPFFFYGAEQPFWYSLTIGTIGGVLASLIVILFFVPLFLLPD